jgi:peptide/nickel transport system substrate-binding protein
MPEMFHSSNTDPGEGNFTGYVNEELDPKLKKQLATTDRQERIDLLHDLQSAVNEDVPMHPINQMPALMAHNSNQVSGWVDYISGYNYFPSMVNIEVDNEDNTLRGTWPETLSSLNHLAANAPTSKQVYQWEMIYDKLVRLDSNIEPDAEMSLATEWEQPDLRTVRYKIREGHEWHDGEPVTPEDVKWTLEFIRDQEVPLYAQQWEMYKDGEVTVDGQWVEVTFSQDVGPVHTLFSNQVRISPKHKWEDRENPTEANVQEPVGSGPLQVDYWDQGSELSLEKFEKHFSPVNYDRRVWRIIPESSTVWSLLKDGDLNYLPFSRIGKQLNDNQDLDQISVYQMPGNSIWHCSMNTRVDGLGDRSVRQAVVNTIPKTAIVDQMLFGFPKNGFNLIPVAFGQYSGSGSRSSTLSVEKATRSRSDRLFASRRSISCWTFESRSCTLSRPSVVFAVS